MYCDTALLSTLPPQLSSTELCAALHISKQTAISLIHSGLLPMTVEQRHNRCFSVSKFDLEALLRRLERCPELRSILSETLCRGVSKPYQRKVRVLPPELSATALRQYYETALADWPTILNVHDVCRFTGYRRTAVRNWMLRGELRFLAREPRYQVPKPWLIDCLCSEQYNQKSRKSDTHVRQLWEAYQGRTTA